MAFVFPVLNNEMAYLYRKNLYLEIFFICLRKKQLCPNFFVLSSETFFNLCYTRHKIDMKTKMIF